MNKLVKLNWFIWILALIYAVWYIPGTELDNFVFLWLLVIPYLLIYCLFNLLAIKSQWDNKAQAAGPSRQNYAAQLILVIITSIFSALSLFFIIFNFFQSSLGY